jgi:hypothetical protein
VLKLGSGGLYSTGTQGNKALEATIAPSTLTIQSSSNGFGGALAISGTAWCPDEFGHFNQNLVVSSVTGNQTCAINVGNNASRGSNCTMRIINGAGLVASGNGGSYSMGSCNSNNLYIGPGSSLNIAQSFVIGNGTLSVGNSVIVDKGTLRTTTPFKIGSVGSNCLNSLIVSNGGLVTASGNGYTISVPDAAATNDYGNYILVTDPGSRLDLLGYAFTLGGAAAPSTLNASTASNGMTVVNGGVFTNVSTITMSGYETYLNIASNGQVWVTTTGLRIGVKGLGGTNDTGCGVNLTTGGLLDLGSSSLGVGNVNSANNYLTNNAGILQFSTATPTIGLTNGAGNNITITNGTISFRKIKNADVFMEALAKPPSLRRTRHLPRPPPIK